MDKIGAILLAVLFGLFIVVVLAALVACLFYLIDRTFDELMKHWTCRNLNPEKTIMMENDLTIYAIAAILGIIVGLVIYTFVLIVRFSIECARDKAEREKKRKDYIDRKWRYHLLRLHGSETNGALSLVLAYIVLALGVCYGAELGKRFGIGGRGFNEFRKWTLIRCR